jgi:hypothetical protein
MRLSLDQIRMPLGTFIYQFPTLLKILTLTVFYIELIAPILIALPLLPNKVRLFGMLCYLCVFVGIASTLYVGLFYIIGIISLIGLLPCSFMDWFESRFYKNKTLYISDSVSNLKSNMIISMTHTFKNYFLIAVMAFCLMMNLGSVKKFPFYLDPAIVAYGKSIATRTKLGNVFAFYFKGRWLVCL